MKTRKDYIDLLKKASDSYYNDEPVMTDEEFDNLRDEFEKQFPGDSFLKEVGSKVRSSFKVTKHEIPMGSLLKVNTESETLFWIEKYAQNKEFIWSEKIDGLSISLYYEKGEFKKAVTRGDGVEGEDVTENVRRMQFTKKLKFPFTGFVRGEIVLEKKDYETFFSDMKNPRNAAAGSVRRIDGQRCEHLKIFTYWIDGEYSKEEERFLKLKELNLKTPAFGIAQNISEIQKVWEKYESGVRDKTPYEIDGLCLYVNSVADQDELGIIDNRPRYARAYKFSPQSATSRIESVEWFVGRTGRVTPVAKITPVNVAGALITNISLHNVAEIERKGILINQIVHIERKGDVIPQITKVVGGGTPIVIPTVCPCCSTTLVRDEIFITCPNKSCPEQEVQSLLFWLKTLDIKGFGDKMVQKLYETNKVRKIKDFYTLSEKDISGLERSGEKLAQKLIKELHSKTSLEPEVFIKALGMEDFGEGVAKLLLEKHRFESIFSLAKEDLLLIHGIGDETAKKVVSGLRDNKSQIESLLKIVSLKEKTQGPLSGQTFCFTGFRDKEKESLIKSLGGSMKDTVNKTLNYLITKDLESGSSKIEKAKSNGVKVITLEELGTLLKDVN